jgi:hypothetical protein
VKARRFGLVIVGALALALAGCDSFSLRKQFTLPDDTPAALALAVTKSSVAVGGSVGLSASGGTPPYEFAVDGDDVAPLTASNPVGSATATTFNSGTAIGRMRITVTDALENTAFAYVTVLPASPVFKAAPNCDRIGGNQTINLAWNYSDSSTIDKLRLEYSVDGVSFSAVQDFTNSTTSYTENGLDTAATYSYRLYAVSGPYVSEPAFISLPPK